MTRNRRALEAHQRQSAAERDHIKAFAETAGRREEKEELLLQRVTGNEFETDRCRDVWAFECGQAGDPASVRSWHRGAEMETRVRSRRQIVEVLIGQPGAFRIPAENRDKRIEDLFAEGLRFPEALELLKRTVAEKSGPSRRVSCSALSRLSCMRVPISVDAFSVREQTQIEIIAVMKKHADSLQPAGRRH